MITGNVFETGLREMLSKYDKIRNNIPKMQSVTIESILKMGFDIATALVPVRTGFLKSSIGYDVMGLNSGRLFVTAPYAAAVNFGTSAMPPRPFFTIAAMEMLGSYGDIVAQIADDTFIKIQDPHVLNVRASRAYYAEIRKTFGRTAREHARTRRKYGRQPGYVFRRPSALTGARRYTQTTRTGQRRPTLGGVVRRRGPRRGLR